MVKIVSEEHLSEMSKEFLQWQAPDVQASIEQP